MHGRRGPTRELAPQASPPQLASNHHLPSSAGCGMSTPLTTPSRPTAPPARAPLVAPSPHYQTKDHKRHSLYGNEDRVVLDPGSSVWKVGFSGEAKPRAVFWAGEHDDGSTPIWEEEFEAVVVEELRSSNIDEDVDGGVAAGGVAQAGGQGEGNWKRELGEEIVQRRIGDRLRQVFAK